MPSLEHELIAFSTSELPAGPWLVFAPHADDETFGMGGTLLKAKKAGIATHVIVLTDGALGGDQDDLVSVRESVAEVTVIERQITPLMLRMIDAMEQFVSLDVPFLLDQRRDRVERLKAMMGSAEISACV